MSYQKPFGRLSPHLIIFLCFSTLFAASRHDVLGATDAEIADLVRRLGAKEYADRKKASAALLEIGRPALRAVEAAAKNSDPEIRLRAKAILNDIKLGINPHWPEDIRRGTRGFEKLDSAEKKELIERLLANSEKEAVPFLLNLVEKGDSRNAEIATKALLKMQDKKTLWKTVLSRKKKALNNHQIRLFAEAAKWSGGFSDVLKALKFKNLDGGVKRGLIASRIAILQEYLDDEEFDKVDEEAGKLAETAPDNAVVLYIHADALLKLKRTKEADTLNKKALLLNPGSEEAHYAAGTFLTDSGKFKLGEKEWKKILEIPPAGDVYDMNAYLRLANIYSQSKLYKKALKAMETGLEQYQKGKEKHGRSMGMIEAKSVDKKLAYLRWKAKKFGDAPGMEIKDIPPGKTYVNINVNVIMKKGTRENMKNGMKNALVTLNLNIQPYGIGLLKKNILTMRYDKKKKQFAVLLNNSPCAVKNNIVFKDETANIAVIDLDVCNIYRVDRDTGEAELRESYEKDYKLTVSKGNRIRLWKKAEISLNNKKHTWKELAKGIHYDFLPEKLNVKLKGISPSGKHKKTEFTVKIRF
ncbi:MAG: hypothetical protein GXP32_04365 [Kiritimatiellaeota bacterium]|nr:hypothetical protein [Kiritimatiellota bacterium]